ncbi:MAG TPA: helix-turn-helix domain-containing protein [Candidatus Omnitrophota bacterium]|nr:helix-turn-helix domain-containing protein [Candidatus Omnitrophota bacterium]
MAKVRLENIDGYFKELMKNKKYRHYYEIERAKVALAQRIAEMREEKHLNQKELAAKMGVSQQFISQIETGEGKNLTLDTLIRLATSLGHKVRISFPKIVGQSAQLEIM